MCVYVVNNINFVSEELVPAEIQQEVKQLYSALCELLRHFWSCFPVTSKTLEEKVCFMDT